MDPGFTDADLALLTPTDKLLIDSGADPKKILERRLATLSTFAGTKPSQEEQDYQAQLASKYRQQMQPPQQEEPGLGTVFGKSALGASQAFGGGLLDRSQAEQMVGSIPFIGGVIEPALKQARLTFDPRSENDLNKNAFGNIGAELSDVLNSESQANQVDTSNLGFGSKVAGVAGNLVPFAVSLAATKGLGVGETAPLFARSLASVAAGTPFTRALAESKQRENVARGMDPEMAALESAKELGVGSVMNAIPGVGNGMNFVKAALARGALGTGMDVANQAMFSDKPIDWSQALATGTVFSALGAGHDFLQKKNPFAEGMDAGGMPEGSRDNIEHTEVKTPKDKSPLSSFERGLDAGKEKPIGTDQGDLFGGGGTEERAFTPNQEQALESLLFKREGERRQAEGILAAKRGLLNKKDIEASAQAQWEDAARKRFAPELEQFQRTGNPVLGRMLNRDLEAYHKKAMPTIRSNVEASRNANIEQAVDTIVNLDKFDNPATRDVAPTQGSLFGDVPQPTDYAGEAGPGFTSRLQAKANLEREAAINQRAAEYRAAYDSKLAKQKAGEDTAAFDAEARRRAGIPEDFRLSKKATLTPSAQNQKTEEYLAGKKATTTSLKKKENEAPVVNNPTEEEAPKPAVASKLEMDNLVRDEDSNGAKLFSLPEKPKAMEGTKEEVISRLRSSNDPRDRRLVEAVDKGRLEILSHDEAVNSFSPEMQTKLKNAGARPGGWYDPRTDKIAIVPENLPKGELYSTLLHEGGVHAGMQQRGELASRISQLSTRVHALADEGNSIALEAVQHVAKRRNKGTIKDDKAYQREITASFVEGVEKARSSKLTSGLTKALEIVKDFYSAVKAFAANNKYLKGLVDIDKLTPRDYHALAEAGLKDFVNREPLMAGDRGKDFATFPELSTDKIDNLMRQLGDSFVKKEISFDEFHERNKALIERRYWAQKREDALHPNKELSDVFPGIKRIPIGARIRGNHGLSIKPGTMGTVVGEKHFTLGRDRYMLPEVVFDEAPGQNFAGDSRRLLPHNIEEVYSPRGVPSSSEKDFSIVDNLTRWFRSSKVSNDDGTPKRVYTGTSVDKDFNKFKEPKNGIWFTEDPEEASQYAKDNDSKGFTWDGGRPIEKNTSDRVLPVYLRIENPKVLDRWPDSVLHAQNYKRAQGILFDQLKGQGYDGVRIGKVWVAFKADQIKSAIGNNGDFSDHPRMDFSLRDLKDEPSENLASTKLKGGLYHLVRQVIPVGERGGALGKELGSVTPWAIRESKENTEGGKHAIDFDSRKLVAAYNEAADKEKLPEASKFDLFKQVAEGNTDDLAARYPETAKALANFFKQSTSQGKQIGKLILEATPTDENGNYVFRSEQEKATFLKTVSNSGHFTRAYSLFEGTKSEQRKFGEGRLGDYKWAIGKFGDKFLNGEPLDTSTLSSRNKIKLEIAQKVQAGIKYLQDKELLFPDLSDSGLKKLSTDRLKSFVWSWTNQATDSMSRSDLVRKAREIVLANKDSDTYKQAQQMIEKILLREESPGPSYLNKGYSVDLSSLKARENVPPEMRDLFGEIKDTDFNIIHTLGTQANILAHLKLTNEIYEGGKRGGYVKDAQEVAPDSSFVTLPDSARYGRLAGTKVAPRIAEFLEASISLEDPSAIMAGLKKGWNAYRGLVALAKVTQVGLNPTSQILQNSVSTMSQMMTTGITPVHPVFWKALKEVTATWLSHSNSKAAKAFVKASGVSEDTIREIIRYGHTDTAALGEDSTRARRNLDTLLLRQRQGYNTDVLTKRAGNLIKGGIENVRDFVGLFDAGMKRAAALEHFRIFKEISKLEEDGMTDDQIMRMATDRAKDITPTYGRAWNAVKLTEKTGITAFATWMTEITRTLYNSAAYIKSDLQNASKLSNPQAQKLARNFAFKRMVGSIAALSAMSALAAVYQGYTTTESERKKQALVKSGMGDFHSSDNLIYGGELPGGGSWWIPAGRYDNFDPFKKLFRPMLEEQLYGASPSTSFVDRLGTTLSASGPLTKLARTAASSVTGDSMPRSSEYYNDPELYKQHLEQAQLGGLLNPRQATGLLYNAQSFMPGAVADWKKGEELAKKYGNSTLEWLTKAGVKPVVYDPRDQLRFAGRVLSGSEVDHARENLKDVLVPGGNVNSIRKYLAQYVATQREQYSKLPNQIKAARLSGVSDNDIFASLVSGGMSRTQAADAITGNFHPQGINVQSLIQDERKAIAEAKTPQDRIKLQQQYNELLRLVNGLNKEALRGSK